MRSTDQNHIKHQLHLLDRDSSVGQKRYEELQNELFRTYFNCFKSNARDLSWLDVEITNRSMSLMEYTAFMAVQERRTVLVGMKNGGHMIFDHPWQETLPVNGTKELKLYDADGTFSILNVIGNTWESFEIVQQEKKKEKEFELQRLFETVRKASKDLGIYDDYNKDPSWSVLPPAYLNLFLIARILELEETHSSSEFPGLPIYTGSSWRGGFTLSDILESAVEGSSIFNSIPFNVLEDVEKVVAFRNKSSFRKLKGKQLVERAPELSVLNAEGSTEESKIPVMKKLSEAAHLNDFFINAALVELSELKKSTGRNFEVKAATHRFLSGRSVQGYMVKSRDPIQRISKVLHRLRLCRYVTGNGQYRNRFFLTKKHQIEEPRH